MGNILEDKIRAEKNLNQKIPSGDTFPVDKIVEEKSQRKKCNGQNLRGQNTSRKMPSGQNHRG